MIEGTWKITEGLVFLTPAVRYTLKSLIQNCRDRIVYNRNTNKFWKGCSHTDPTFGSNY